MKIKSIQLITGMALLLSSCISYDWDENNGTTLSPFVLSNPELQIEINESNKTETEQLAWEKSHTEDHSLVFYTVLFSTTASDFSTPFYTMETKTVGSDAFLDLTFDEFNVIAEKAGIAQESTGTIYWAVVASNGVSSMQSSNIGEIAITRPLGYAYNPTSLYLLQEGDDETAMQPLRMVAQEEGTGEFEIFAELSLDKKFYLVEQLSDKSFRRFALDGTKLVTGDDKSTAALSNGVHRIYVNFNDASASIAHISKIEVWYDATQSCLGEMTQIPGEMKWSLDYAFTAVENNYKYKFRMTETAPDGTTSIVYWGSSAKEPVSQTTSTKPDYFYLYKVADDAYNCYRLNRTMHNNKNLTFELDLTTSAAWYTHKVIVE